jgi:hypothetical protein
VLAAPGVKWPFVRPSEEKASPDDLEDAVLRVVARMTAEATTKCAVLGVAVERRDGMSWSATKAREIVASELEPTWDVRCIWDYADREDKGVRELVDLLGGGDAKRAQKAVKRSIRRAVGSSSLVPKLHRPWGWWFLGLMIMILFTTLAAAVTNAGKGGTAPLLWASVALAPVMTLIARVFTPKITPLSPAEADRLLEVALSEAPRKNDAEDRFVSLILERLAPRRARAMVIEDFGRLSQRTQEVVVRYLGELEHPRQKELWILFSRGRRGGRPARGTSEEPLNAPELSTLPLGHNVDRWYCRQTELSEQDKVLVLQLRDRRTPRYGDPRLRQSSIGHVVSPPTTSAEVDAPDLSSELRDLSPPVVRAFGLLATAASVSDPATFTSAELADIAREGSYDSELRTLFRDWFPDGSRSPATIKATFDTLNEELSALLDVTAGDERATRSERRRARGQGKRTRLGLMPVYADAFLREQTWQRYDLPSQDRAHALWALYWQGKLARTWSAPVADRLVTHLRAIKQPERFRSAREAKLARRLFDAACDAVEGSLALSVAGLTPESRVPDGALVYRRGLLDQARLLLAVESGVPSRRESERLRTLAWLAYMLTGEQSITETIASLNDDLAETGAVAEEDVLLALYGETVPSLEGAPATAVETTNELAASVAGHARARAAWFALLLAPVVQWRPPEDVDAAITAAPEATLSVADGALARLRNGSEDSWAAIDYLTLSHVLLCDALSAWQGRGSGDGAEERREAVTKLATEHIARREHSGRRTHFILDGLVRQLDATGRGCAAVGRSDHGNGALSDLQEALGTLESLHIMWHNMELYELADLAVLAYNTLIILAGPAARAAADGVGLPGHLIGIGTGAGSDVHRIEAEMLLAATRIGVNATSALVPMARAANLAIRDELGADVTLTLSASVLALPNTPEWAQLEPILDYAIEPRAERPGVLDVPEGEFVEAAQMVLETVISTTSPLTLKACEVVRRRAADIASPWLKDRVEQRLEAFRARLDGPPNLPSELNDLLTRWRRRALGSSEPGHEGAAQAAPVAYRIDTRHTYAYVLAFLWDAADTPGNTLVDDALRVLSHRDGPVHRGQVVLALNVSRRFEGSGASPGSFQALPSGQPASVGVGRSTSSTATSPRAVSVSFASVGGAPPRRPPSDSDNFRVALEVLRDGIEAAAASLWPSSNLEIYRRLWKYDEPRRAEYAQRIDYWRAEDERASEEPMFDNAAAGRAFEVFWHHYIRVYELPLDGSREELDEMLMGPPRDIWDPSAAIPEALFHGSDGLARGVCRDFVRAGYYISYAAGKNGVPDAGRGLHDELHDVASANIDDLYRLLVEQAPIPLPLREIFRSQRDRFRQL